MFRGPSNTDSGVIWAIGTATLSAAGSTNLTLSLPSGAIGMPVRIKASGGVAGNVVLQISNSQQIVVLVNPNAPPSEETIPARAFPGKQGSVAVTVTMQAAGSITVAVAFKP